MLNHIVNTLIESLLHCAWHVDRLGLHCTSGLVKRKDFIGQFDSDVIVLMKKAGAIMLAITNVPELCMWWESLNNVYGRSRNPYDTNRTVGGSSGGEVYNPT